MSQWSGDNPALWGTQRCPPSRELPRCDSAQQPLPRDGTTRQTVDGDMALRFWRSASQFFLLHDVWANRPSPQCFDAQRWIRLEHLVVPVADLSVAAGKNRVIAGFDRRIRLVAGEEGIEVSRIECGEYAIDGDAHQTRS